MVLITSGHTGTANSLDNPSCRHEALPDGFSLVVPPAPLSKFVAVVNWLTAFVIAAALFLLLRRSTSWPTWAAAAALATAWRLLLGSLRHRPTRLVVRDGRVTITSPAFPMLGEVTFRLRDLETIAVSVPQRRFLADEPHMVFVLRSGRHVRALYRCAAGLMTDLICEFGRVESTPKRGAKTGG